MRAGRLAPRALAISRDGTRVLAGNDDSCVRLFDLERRAELATLAGHGAGVNAVAFSADAATAVLGYSTGALCAQRLLRETPGPELTSHGHFVFALRLTPDGREVVSVALDGVLRVSDLSGGRERFRLRHGYAIFSVDLSADGRRALTAGGSELRLWDIERGCELASRLAHPGAVHSFAAIDASGRRAVSGAEDGVLLLWDLESGEKLAAIPTGSDGISALAHSRDGRRALAGYAYGPLRLIDLESRKTLRTYPAHQGWVRDVRITPDGRRNVSVAQNRTLALIDLETGAALPTPLACLPVAAISVDPAGQIAVADIRGRIHRLQR